MFNIPTTNTVAENTVVINNHKFMVTDKLAEQIYSMIMGEQSMSKPIVNAPQSNYVASENTNTKSQYVATKDFVPQYEIKEQTSVDGTKLYCISRKNGWTKAEKSLMNGAIKTLKGVKEIDVEYIKDGKKRTFKAWGYNTEATAKKHFKELPTVFTVAQLNGVAL